MTKQLESVEQYLEQVSKYLEPLSDKDQIITELRAHIWDQANRLSEENKELSVQAAFDQAIRMMENPEILAAKFLEEESGTTRIDWKAPIKAPEVKVKNEQFLILAIVGFGAVIVMSWILQMTTDEPVISIVSLILGIFATGMFILGLHLSDEKLFRKQLTRFRELFQKPPSLSKGTPNTSGAGMSFVKDGSITIKEVGFWRAFGEHFVGVIIGIFIVFAFAFLFLLETMNLPLFNDKWYPIGALATYIALGTYLAYSAFLVIFGRIRITRLLSAAKNLIGFACAIILLVNYPFAMEVFNILLGPLLDPGTLAFLANGDAIMQVIIAIIGIIQAISALYDIFKFGAWKPSDRKSLI